MVEHRRKAREALDASIRAIQDGNPRDVNAAAREFAWQALDEFHQVLTAYQAGEVTEEQVRATMLGRAVDELMPDWTSNK